MSAAQHTAAPWHAGGPHQCTVYDRFGQRIANSFEGVMATQRSDGECAANARLIAAAPELLAIAKAALPGLRHAFMELASKYAGTPFENDPAYIAAKQRLDDCKAAIAKATGEAS